MPLLTPARLCPPEGIVKGRLNLFKLAKCIIATSANDACNQIRIDVVVADETSAEVSSPCGQDKPKRRLTRRHADENVSIIVLIEERFCVSMLCRYVKPQRLDVAPMRARSGKTSRRMLSDFKIFLSGMDSKGSWEFAVRC